MTLVIVAVAVIGTLSLKSEPETIQGQIEVAEYRVSSKVPGRILELRVKEGDYVNVGDTLAILDAPDVRAKMTQAESAENAAAAMDEMANNGARKEQVRAAFAVLQQAKAGLDIAEKSYNRVQRLFDEGVVTAQKRDEAFANYKALEAQVKAAQSQYDMALNGARMEEKKAAAAQVNRAKGAVAEVSSYINETMQIAQMAGEVSDVYPKIGELVGTGSPIMSISMMNDMWHIQRARGPARRHEDWQRDKGFRTGLQPRDTHEGVLHQGSGIIRSMEGYQVERTVRLEDFRGEGSPYRQD